MIKINGTILACKLAAIVIYEIDKKTNQDFVNQIRGNEKLLESMADIFEKSLEEIAEIMNKEPIGKPHSKDEKLNKKGNMKRSKKE